MEAMGRCQDQLRLHEWIEHLLEGTRKVRGEMGKKSLGTEIALTECDLNKGTVSRSLSQKIEDQIVPLAEP
jgi:hypothetical protein